jgi:hypothetical protein
MGSIFARPQASFKLVVAGGWSFDPEALDGWFVKKESRRRGSMLTKREAWHRAVNGG